MWITLKKGELVRDEFDNLFPTDITQSLENVVYEDTGAKKRTFRKATKDTR